MHLRNKKIKRLIAMHVEDLENHLHKIDNLLSEDSCTGFPYLSLKKCDYSLKNTDAAYHDYISLIKKFGYENNWDNGKITLFDVHPVFSNAKVIPGIMGLHLSLILLDKLIAGTTQTLYFDTVSNWLKFTKLSDKRVFALASWMRFDSDIISTDEEETNDSTDNNGFIFTKTSILLIKGNELANIHQNPPTDFNQKLFTYYKENPSLLKKDCDARSILEKELSNYCDFIESSLHNHSRLKDSALYLFMVIFCREFGLKHEIFNSLILEYGYKFDFYEDKDILQYTDLAFAYIDDLRIRIGEYSEIDLTFTQVDTDFSQTLSSEIPLNNSQIDEKHLENIESITQLIEYRKNFSVGGVRRFYEMKPALTLNDISNAVYEEWRNLVFCFLFKNLSQEYYNKLRSIMDSHVRKEIERNKLSEYQNFDYQQAAIKKTAFQILQSTLYDHFKINNDECSEIAKNIFQRLKMPKLTVDQEREKNILNSKAQLEYVKSVHNDLLLKLNLLLQQSIGKIAHPSFLHELGESISRIDHETLKAKIIYWYVTNYVEKYLEMSDDYLDIYAMIELDANNFATNDSINKSLLKEVRSFVRTRHDPSTILDFAINY